MNSFQMESMINNFSIGSISGEVLPTLVQAKSKLKLSPGFV